MGRRADHSREELQRLAVLSTRKIIQSGGLRAATIRKIADEMGYTSGTLYQHFRNLDALLMKVHVETLRDLKRSLESVDFSLSPEEALLSLAHGYSDFARQHRNLWNALFEHEWPEENSASSEQEAEVAALIGLAAKCVAKLLPDASQQDVQHEARTLWACLYGIVSLDSVGKLSKTEGADAILVSLVTNYLAGLTARQKSSQGRS